MSILDQHFDQNLIQKLVEELNQKIVTQICTDEDIGGIKRLTEFANSKTQGIRIYLYQPGTKLSRKRVTKPIDEKDLCWGRTFGGGRCTRRGAKLGTANSHYCSQHLNNTPHGIWSANPENPQEGIRGQSRGTIRDIYLTDAEKQALKVKNKPKKVKKEKKKKVPKPTGPTRDDKIFEQFKDYDDSDDENQDDENQDAENQDDEVPNDNDAPDPENVEIPNVDNQEDENNDDKDEDEDEDEDEDDDLDVEEWEIDGVTYLKDDEDNIYENDPENPVHVGKLEDGHLVFNPEYKGDDDNDDDDED